MSEYIRVTYVRSKIGRNYRQGRVLKALGLRRLQQSRVMVDNPSIRGMINKIPHLLTVEAADKPVITAKPKTRIPKTTKPPVKAKPKTSKKLKETKSPVKVKPETKKKLKDPKPAVKAKPKATKKSVAKKADKPDKHKVSADLIKDDVAAPITDKKTVEESSNVKDESTETDSNA